MKIPDAIPAEGISIPLKVAFGGIKNIPLLSFSHNSMNPKLILFDDATETRVIFKRRRPLSEIDTINVTLPLRTLHLTVNWKSSLFSFTAAIESEETVLSVVRFFQRKGVTLGDGAHRFLGEPKKDEATLK